MNAFTPFLPDALGAPAPGPLHFVGEGKRRSEAKPCRIMVVSLLAAGFLALFAASALTCQRLVEIDRGYAMERV